MKLILSLIINISWIGIEKRNRQGNQIEMNFKIISEPRRKSEYQLVNQIANKIDLRRNIGNRFKLLRMIFV